MMLDRHHDEESLIALLQAGRTAVSGDAHLSGCGSCTDLLESYRVIAEVLSGREVWSLEQKADEKEAAAGAASLRSFVTAMEDDDERAAVLVEQLRGSPRQWWLSTVARDERFHSAGAARRLVSLSEELIGNMPPDAIEAARAALEVTEKLDKTPRCADIRGSALRQLAYSLFYVGDFKNATDAIEQAQQTYDACPVSDYGMARLNIVRALVCRALDRHQEALKLARECVPVFRSFGDLQRLASASMTEAYILMHLHRFDEALAVLCEMQDGFGASIDVDTRARTIHNIAFCQQSLGRIPEALRSYQIAANLFDEAKAATEAARMRYGVAVLLAGEGKHREARQRLAEVQAEFTRLGMAYTAVVVGLDLAEIALLANDFSEVERLCRQSIGMFETAGLAHSTEALTALTFLREAAEQRRATQETVWHVKTYIQRLPSEPALVFAPTPHPFF